MKYIIAYDIENDKRRRKIVKLLSSFGVRIQFSVFECRVSNLELNTLTDDLEKIINSKKDSVLIFPLCQKCNDKRISLGASINERLVKFIEV